MKIVSWNVNSIRQRTRPESDPLGHLLRSERPDVVCLQELQCRTHQVPVDALRAAGYRATVSAQAGKNGVAILSALSQPPSAAAAAALPAWPPAGSPAWMNAEARFCAETVRGVVVASVYVPYGRTPEDEQWQHKLQFFRALGTWSKEVVRGGQCLLLAGDFNVAPRDADCTLPPAHPHAWPPSWAAWCHPDMRRALADLLAVGLVDLTAAPGQARAPTLFDQRNYGRGTEAGVHVDLLLGTLSMQARLQSAFTLSEARSWPRPSDHVPVGATFRDLERIFSCFVGSRLHGTATAQSDVDVSGIVLPPVSELLLGRGASREQVQRKKPAGERNVAADVDVHFRSPLEWIEHLLSGQPVAWEVLFAPPAVHTADCQPLGRKFLLTIRSLVPRLRSSDVSAALGNCKQHLKRIERELDLAGLDAASASALPRERITPADWKKLAHALRVLEQHGELLSRGAITLPRPNAGELCAIRAGACDLSAVLARIEEARAELVRASEDPALRPSGDGTPAYAAVASLFREHLGLPVEANGLQRPEDDQRGLRADSRTVAALDLAA